jgi:hypothetical protein
MTSDELQGKIIAKVKDDSAKVAPDDYESAAAEALKRYSKHRPRLVCEDLTGNGTNDLLLPTGWSEGISSIVSIEYPMGQVPETLLDTDYWTIYQQPAGKRLRLLEAKPTALERVRVLYSALHPKATIPAADEDAIANLAASICLRLLATAYGQTGEPLIQADVVNYRSKTDEFRRLADSFEKIYKDHLGLKESDTTPAAMTTVSPPDKSRTRLTHY